MEMEIPMDNREALCAEWLEAKRAETAANKRRIEIETQLAQCFEVPDEGSKTHKLDSYKITLTQPVSRKVDEAIWDQVKRTVPAALRPVKMKLEADATGCKYLVKNEPEIWARIATAFETKPGKIGVKVEAV
jgi:hypothetical protein